MQPSGGMPADGVRPLHIGAANKRIGPTGVDPSTNHANRCARQQIARAAPMDAARPKHLFALLCLLAALVAWSPASFAQRQTAVGPGTIPLAPTGVVNGVDLSGSATTGTLTVGVPGGPAMDIFTSNASLTSPLLAVSTGASSQGNIVFNSSSTVYGTIGVTPPGGPFLLDISGGANGTAVNFLGPVYATTTFVTGTGSMNFNSGSTNQSPNGLIFNGDGTIGLAPNTTLVGAITTADGTNAGTLVLGGGSVLTGAIGAASASLRAINVVGGSATTGVSASISGAVNAYSFNLGTNTLLIGGALTIADSTSTGVINTTLGSPTVYGSIRPVGVTTIGPSIAVAVTVPATALIPVGTVFNIVQTQTGTSQVGSNGRTVTVTDPTNPLYTFSGTPTIAGLVQITTLSTPITVIPVVPPVGPVAPLPPITPIAIPVVPVILSPPDIVPLAPVVTAIDALTTPAAVVDALVQLAPSTPDLVAPLVTFQGTREFEDLLQSRLDESLCGQVPHAEQDAGTCRWNEPHDGWWLKGFGYFGSQGSQGAFPGYNSIIAGTMIGYDMPLETPLGGETRAGFGIGYARNIINGDTFSTSTDANTYQATAYVGHEQGPWFVYGDLSFGWNDYSGTRPISFPGINQTAQASYGGQDYTAFMTTGFHFPVSGFTITPLASLQYTHVNLDGYTETGAGNLDLKVNSQGDDFLESGLGVKVDRLFGTASGTYVPEVHVKWYHELINPTLQNTAAFALAGSPSFTTPGLRTADDTFNPGVGVTFLSCACTGKTWTLEAVYDYFWRSDAYSANQAMIRFTTRF